VKTRLLCIALLVGAIPGHAASPWGEVVFADAFEGLATCPSTVLVPDGTTRTRLFNSNISYGVFPPFRPAAYLGEYDNIWGHNTPYDGVTAWPGVAGAAPVIKEFHRWNYIAAHFRTPSTVSPGFASRFVNPTAIGGPNSTMAISRACGDFANHLPTPGCLSRDVPTADAQMVYWQFSTWSPQTACNLETDTDYYVNIIQSDEDSHTECAGDICPVAPWRN